MTAHGVGFKLPNVPLLTALRTSLIGAKIYCILMSGRDEDKRWHSECIRVTLRSPENIKLAAKQPMRGQTYSRTMTCADNIVSEK